MRHRINKLTQLNTWAKKKEVFVKILLSNLVKNGKITTTPKRAKDTRDESERRDKITSLRSSENELKRIKKNAKDAGMTVNSFLNNVGANGVKMLTPALMVELQNQTNYACAVVEKYAPDEVETMQEGMDKLWQKLI